MNSARSLYDNLDQNKYELSLIYFNPELDAFNITEAQIYSNTPLDFDYKLSHGAKSLNKEELKGELNNADLVIPAIHGIFGEDGQLQTILEEAGVKYIGSQPEACKSTCDKQICQQILQENGFFTLQNWTMKKGDRLPELPDGKYVIKPLHGGSSLGVQYFNIPTSGENAMQKKLDNVFSHEDEAIIEPFFKGTEFTIIVIENAQGEPVALLPSEIEFHNEEDKFFNYRKKYLATAETRYHTPARFSKDTIEKIRSLAEKAFKDLGMRDIARIDGWTTEDKTIWFSDINAISGMEQNSFLFQQAALLGLSHRQLLDYLINKKIDPPSNDDEKREDLPVIFGGSTAERQVSVLSGTNVWIKLKSSPNYKPLPLLLTSKNKIFRVPHFVCLHHTVEEMEEKISILQDSKFIEDLKEYEVSILNRLEIDPGTTEEKIFTPFETTFEDIANNYKFLFLGLHGGDGENGAVQAKLDALQLPYNGPGADASSLCMDKYATGEKIHSSNADGIATAPKKTVQLNANPEEIWNELNKEGLTAPLILKPRSDGCSAGVIRIDSQNQFQKAIQFFQNDHPHIPGKAIHNDHGQIDLPIGTVDEILVEEYMHTDDVNLQHLEIDWRNDNDVVEVTIGLIGEPGQMKAFNPSQTIASQKVLSLEEKFMGGTGINLTPPPPPFVKSEVVEKSKQHAENVAKILNLEGYTRIDAFMNIKTGDLTIIEANTLPGLSPSTVLFQQALAESEPIMPRELLEKIIEIGKKRFQKKTLNDREHGNFSKSAKIESFEEKT